MAHTGALLEIAGSMSGCDPAVCKTPREAHQNERELQPAPGVVARRPQSEPSAVRELFAQFSDDVGPVFCAGGVSQGCGIQIDDFNRRVVSAQAPGAVTDSLAENRRAFIVLLSHHNPVVGHESLGMSPS